MQPFTLDQSIITGLLFLLGLLIGMYFLAGGKSKRLYRQEAARREVLEAENEKLRRDLQQARAARDVVPVHPQTVAPVATKREVPRDEIMDDPPLGGPYRKTNPGNDPDIVIRRP